MNVVCRKHNTLKMIVQFICDLLIKSLSIVKITEG
jgi:hypothetical protein